MREVTLKVEFKVPQATELEKLEKKSLVTFIYVGKPTAEFRKKLGNESRIQLNDSYAEVAEIQDYIIGERASMKEEDQPQMTVSLKVDQDTKMGIVTDIKEALRKAAVLGWHTIEKLLRAVIPGRGWSFTLALKVIFSF